MHSKPVLYQAAIKYKDQYAHGYIDEIAYTEQGSRNELAYARISGKPAFVKAIASGLAMGLSMKMFSEDMDPIHITGSDECKIRLFKIDRIAIASYHVSRLFNHNSNRTLLLGKDHFFIKEAFNAILKKKPIINHEKWNMMGILKDLSLITTLKGINVTALEVFWNEELINEELSKRIKTKTMSF